TVTAAGARPPGPRRPPSRRRRPPARPGRPPPSAADGAPVRRGSATPARGPGRGRDAGDRTVGDEPAAGRYQPWPCEELYDEPPRRCPERWTTSSLVPRYDEMTRGSDSTWLGVPPAITLPCSRATNSSHSDASRPMSCSMMIIEQ